MNFLPLCCCAHNNHHRGRKHSTRASFIVRMRDPSPDPAWVYTPTWYTKYKVSRSDFGIIAPKNLFVSRDLTPNLDEYMPL
ncbi:hypothetical protein SFRURICE_010439 [Spodoptera frugiperda]|uniref:SFRICE_040614 n=1 Tax=Spodoptera frugiperda TaxID=7108 RepID=A0A2H1W5C4_SPOFR|nr:hypothetical protein SFRURICE_010439 [Spodoptera frugiperda]